jgi:hypothetical protein
MEMAVSWCDGPVGGENHTLDRVTKGRLQFSGFKPQLKKLGSVASVSGIPRPKGGEFYGSLRKHGLSKQGKQALQATPMAKAGMNRPIGQVVPLRGKGCDAQHLLPLPNPGSPV